jgi:hypothetical protein
MCKAPSAMRVLCPTLKWISELSAEEVVTLDEIVTCLASLSNLSPNLL